MIDWGNWAGRTLPLDSTGCFFMQRNLAKLWVVVFNQCQGMVQRSSKSCPSCVLAVETVEFAELSMDIHKYDAL